MAGMRPDEADRFYEEDEDPARVFARFGAAEREGRLQETEPPGERGPELVPLRAVLAELAQELRKLRLHDRAIRALRRLADALGSRGRVH